MNFYDETSFHHFCDLISRDFLCSPWLHSDVMQFSSPFQRRPKIWGALSAIIVKKFIQTLRLEIATQTQSLHRHWSQIQQQASKQSWKVYWVSANKMFLNCWWQFRSRHRQLVLDSQDFPIQLKRISPFNQINRCRCSPLKKTFRQLDAIKFLRASQYSAMVRRESSHAPIGVSSFPTTFS